MLQPKISFSTDQNQFERVNDVGSFTGVTLKIKLLLFESKIPPQKIEDNFKQFGIF